MYLKGKFIVTMFILACRALGANVKQDKIPEIGRMNFIELCHHFNLNCKEEQVITEDGYILTVHHIVGDKKKPVLLWHGLLDCSDTFILRGENSIIAALSGAGYDLWVGNSRGNKYSRRHVSLDPDKDRKEFWDFSFHEMGYYDLAATIDFIIASTGKKKISTIGVSQGTTIFYVLASTRPTYNEKIQIFISMAPIAYIRNLQGLARDLIPGWTVISKLLSLAKIYEVFTAQDQFIQTLCTMKKIGNFICNQIVTMGLAGHDIEELEPDFFKVVIGHFPAGASKKSVDHFVQLYTRKNFANFDYGHSINLEKYGSIEPPEYSLNNVNMSVALICGANDNLSTLKDVELLRNKLPNVVYYKLMDRKEFNHADFQWARNVDTYTNPILIELLSQYT